MSDAPVRPPALNLVSGPPDLFSPAVDPLTLRPGYGRMLKAPARNLWRGPL